MFLRWFCSDKESGGMRMAYGSSVFCVARGLFLFICMSFACSNGFSEDRPPKYSIPDKRVIIVERIQPYEVREYVPNYELQFVAKGRESYSSPEQAAQAYFSSMRNGDYSWSMRTWTSDSAKMNVESDKRAGKSSGAWEAEWKKFYADRLVYLTHRISYGKYVLLAYETRPRNGKGTITNNTMAFVKAINGWRATQELASDPMLTHWSSPGARVQVISDMNFQE